MLTIIFQLFSPHHLYHIIFEARFNPTYIDILSVRLQQTIYLIIVTESKYIANNKITHSLQPSSILSQQKNMIVRK